MCLLQKNIFHMSSDLFESEQIFTVVWLSRGRARKLQGTSAGRLFKAELQIVSLLYVSDTLNKIYPVLFFQRQVA